MDRFNSSRLTDVRIPEFEGLVIDSRSHSNFLSFTSSLKIILAFLEFFCNMRLITQK